MSTALHVLLCLLVTIFINPIECIKLTTENLISLGGEENYLSFKHISEIDPLAVELIQNEILFLSDNELTEIGESLFEKNRKFKKISLSSNKITFIHPNAFNNLKNLEYLEVSSNPLKYFDFNSLSSSKMLKTLYLYDTKLTEIHYQDLKVRFPKLSEVALTGNEFNCSFAKQVIDYLDKEQIKEYYGTVTCISDEEYAAIVKDRQSNSGEQCNKMIIELKNDYAKVKNDNKKLKIINEDMENVIKGLKLQLLERQPVTETGKNDSGKVKIDHEDFENAIKGLSLQMLEQQAVTEKVKNDCEKMKIYHEDVKDVIKGLKLLLLEQQPVTEKGKNDSETVKMDTEDVKEVIRGLKLQKLQLQYSCNLLLNLAAGCPFQSEIRVK